MRQAVTQQILRRAAHPWRLAQWKDHTSCARPQQHARVVCYVMADGGVHETRVQLRGLVLAQQLEAEVHRPCSAATALCLRAAAIRTT